MPGEPADRAEGGWGHQNEGTLTASGDLGMWPYAAALLAFLDRPAPAAPEENSAPREATQRLTSAGRTSAKTPRAAMAPRRIESRYGL
jgi:hypothetical protein